MGRGRGTGRIGGGGGHRGRGRGRGGGPRRGRGGHGRFNRGTGDDQDAANRPMKLELTLESSDDEEYDDDDDEEEYDDDNDEQGEKKKQQGHEHYKNKKKKKTVSGKALYYEKNKHRFDMNYKVLQWSYSDLETPKVLQPVSDYYTSVKQYCFSFLDYVFEETRAEILQSLQTNSHGDIAKCKIVQWKKGKNKGDAAGISFNIIPREQKDSTQEPYIPLFQKHDYVVISRSPRLDELSSQSHFFAIIEEGNQLSVSKFNQQSQPWLRKGGRGGSRRGKRRGMKGGARQPIRLPTSNLSTLFKAKFYVHPHTKHMINLESSKGRSKSGKRIYRNESVHDYWFVIPVYNMVTKHREYESIQRMAVPEFLSETWTKKRGNQKRRIIQRADNIAPKLKEHLQKNYNPAQFKAIDEVLNDVSKKVHLIHGPPGSGKTSTLLGLIMALLANKQRVLICSGTNVAVDHIVAKISKYGLINSNGERYDPSRNKMARIGNDEKIDELSKEIDPATRFKRLVKMIKDIRHKMDAIRKEQFEVLEKSKQSKSVVNARNSIIGRSDKIISLLDMAEATIPQLLTTKLVSKELVEPMNQKFESVKSVILEFLAMGKRLELKKLDLTTAAEAAYKQIEVLCDECQRYLSIDNRDVEKKILDNCDVVFATLAITGRQMMRDCSKFNVLIIDEAAQVTESESMIPLDLITDQVVLIGDPHQLPSTVLSQEAIDKKYNRSMFERIINIVEQEEHAGRVPDHKPVLLDTQYRMHPSISQYPERQFYNNTLKDGENVKQYHVHPDWKPRYDNGLHPCLFINCPESKETFNPTTKSFQNEHEADLVVKLIDLYMTRYGVKKSQIAVITFYRGQVDLIRSKLTKYDEQKKSNQSTTNTSNVVVASTATSDSKTDSKQAREEQENDSDMSDNENEDEYELEDDSEEWYDVNTVDSYQGSEKQVCILSTVRANDRGNLGFCIDRRRLNVAITRAQFSLTIVGHGESLCVNDLWKSFVRNVQILEPQDVTGFSKQENHNDQHILVRSIDRKHLKFVSAILKNKLVKTSSLDGNQLLESCLNTNNHTLLSHFLKLNKIHIDPMTHGSQNLLQECIERKSYLCAAQLLSQPSLLPLVFEKNTRGLLPIQQCIIDYGKCKKDQKAEIVKLFGKLCAIMSAHKEKLASLDVEADGTMFDIKDTNGDSISNLLEKKNYQDLLGVMTKFINTGATTTENHRQQATNSPDTQPTTNTAPPVKHEASQPSSTATTSNVEVPRVTKNNAKERHEKPPHKNNRAKQPRALKPNQGSPAAETVSANPSPTTATTSHQPAPVRQHPKPRIRQYKKVEKQ